MKNNQFRIIYLCEIKKNPMESSLICMFWHSVFKLSLHFLISGLFANTIINKAVCYSVGVKTPTSHAWTGTFGHTVYLMPYLLLICSVTAHRPPAGHRHCKREGSCEVSKTQFVSCGGKWDQTFLNQMGENRIQSEKIFQEK